ncbi:hypothetical protein Tco_0395030 [Tanacetum coccineum]
MYPLTKIDRRGGQVWTTITPDQRVETKGNKGEHGKAAKKGETPNKEKAAAIFMVQLWQRITRQRVTQSFSASQKISFPPLANSDGQESTILIQLTIIAKDH